MALNYQIIFHAQDIVLVFLKVLFLWHLQEEDIMSFAKFRINVCVKYA